MTDTCTTTCARCAHRLIVTDGDIDAEVAAHQERCFVADDMVRWDNPDSPMGPTWIDGRFVTFVTTESERLARIRIESGPGWRPGCTVCVGLSGGITLSRLDLPSGHRQCSPQPDDPLAVKYDDVPLLELLCRDQFTQANDSRRYPALTPVQRAAVSAHWSALLRAKVAASKERDRRQVVLDQDID
jgi:hypothetical protein